MGNNTRITIDGVRQVRNTLDEARVLISKVNVSGSYEPMLDIKKVNKSILEKLENIDICASMIKKKIESISDTFEYNINEVAHWDGGKDELSRAITKSLKKGSAVSVKKANAAYKQLRKIVGKKKATVIVLEIISKIGGSKKYKLSNGVISRIPKGDGNTGSETRNKDEVTVSPDVLAAAVATDSVLNSPFDKITTNDEKYQNAINRITEIADEKADGNAKIRNVYEKAMERINNVDLNSSDAKQIIEAIQDDTNIEVEQFKTQMTRKIDDVNMKYHDNYATLTAEEIDAAGSKNTNLNNSIAAETYQISQRKEATNNYTSLVQDKLSQIENGSNKAVSVAVPQSEHRVAGASYSAENISTVNPAPQQTPNSAPVSHSQTAQTNRGISSAAAPVSAATASVSSTPSENTTVTPSVTETKVPTPKTIIDSKPKVTVIDNKTTNTPTSTKSSSGAGVVIPAVLGVGALGTAGVVGARYIKNRKANEDIDDNYDDEDNSEYFDDNNSGTYTGPEGSTYQDTYDDQEDYNDFNNSNDKTQDEDSYTDIDDYNDGEDDFSEDVVLNSIN